ncbi:2-aminoadipate aminotransferase [Thiopseudomonas alkaliphila]|uniref:MocR-like pyridoxine biosynthesis transcription factor PdxR n=1 Tax=Thiopseudomonas alkaliphila TaxID=1697053 RepID=UPI00069D3320|nr:PLP-dependent aminotransferase family protein [Thiopseudomonas alkaliphila]AKX45001.1 2-aminoadipate aminotransferase [Thiopseudomonas alkaliphila]AKX48308.1 2-aminoadipate aminotransferase [Thiopseudomonas alkaliphila]AKX53437.1 2-aminoadipate aminotransferase [Thiopseudomonas alkaliphila]
MLLFHLDSKLPETLQRQLYKKIANAILDGQIPLDKALPSSRKLASELNVARNTVVLVYEQLLDDGYLLAKSRSGFFVNADILQGHAQQQSGAKNTQGQPIAWENLLSIRPSLQHNIRKPKDWYNYEFPFLYGQLDPTLFPTQHWRECSRDAMNVQNIRSWSIDHFDEDDPLLVEQIRTRLLPRRGVWAKAEQILITVGTQQALWMTAQLLLKPNRRFGMENPGYVDMYNIARLFTDNIQLLTVDEQGMQPELIAADCQLVYVTPSHQSPTNVTMPLKRRRQLLELAEKNNFLIIEDDYNSETNYESNPTPALKSLDQNDRVIYMGSLSKTLAPGLRLGYMVAHPTLIQEIRAMRRLMLRHPPANNQRTLALFIERGYHDVLLRHVHRVLKERWKCMSEALQRHLPQFSTASNVGGTSFWLKAPEGLDFRKLQALARKHSILIECGDIHHFAQGEHEYLRLGFTAIPAEKIEPGLTCLAQLIPLAMTKRQS